MKNIFQTKTISIILLVMILSVSFAFADLSNSDILSLDLVNQDPDPAISGDVVELRIGVTNEGGGISQDMMLELDVSYPFEEISGESYVKEVGQIGSYQSGDNTKIIKYRVKVDESASADDYDLNVLLYEEGKKEQYTVSSNMEVSVKNEVGAEIVLIDQVEISPGETKPINFTIENVGSAPIKDLTFTWSNEDEVLLPVGSSDRKYINYLGIGETAVISYDVIADSNADAGLYKLDLYLTYDDPITGEEDSIESIAGIYLGGGTDFEVAFSDETNSEMSFSVANIGSNPSDSVTIKIPSQEGWMLSGSDTVIIGNLDKGDYTIASFEVQKTNPTINSINIDVIYTDTKGQRKLESKNVVLTQSTSQSTNMSSSDFEEGMPGRGGMGGMMTPNASGISQVVNILKYIGIGVVVLVGGIIFYKKYTKKKRQKMIKSKK